MSKLKSKPSKLNTQKLERESVIKPLKFKEFPRSYRLDADQMNTIKRVLDRINAGRQKRISEARLVKGLIYLSESLSNEVIINAVKEV